jgi:transposase
VYESLCLCYIKCMDNNKLVSKLHKENIQLEAKNTMLEIALKQKDKILKHTISEKDAEIERWKQLYLASNRRIYAKSSETSEQLQLNLFDEPELENLNDAIEHTEGDITEQKVKTYTRRVSQNRTLTLPANTPVVDVYHDGLEDAACDRCEASLQEVGEFTQDTVTFVPATYMIVRHHLPQYKCTNCEPENMDEEGLITSPSASLLNGTICDPSLLAQIVTDKMHYGLPLYRQEKKLQLGDGQFISRQAQSSWMMYVAKNLEGLSLAMERELHKCQLWNMDETGVQVLTIPGKEKTNSKRNAFMIVRVGTHRDGSKGPVVFTYSDNRVDATIATLIGEYEQVLQSDGLSGYENAAKEKEFTHLGCLVHARRPVAELAKQKSKDPLVKELLRLYGKVFHDEGEITDLFRAGDISEEAFLERRREVVGKDFDDLKAWLDTYNGKVLPGSPLQTAINYPLDRWEALNKFLDFPFATSGNQLAENCIRPFAIGRKNFLFCITPQGAKASALYYSLVETCKAMDIDPQKYLTHLFSNAASCKTDSDWDAMLPDKVDLSPIDDYYDTLRKAVPNPDRKEPYMLRGKKR